MPRKFDAQTPELMDRPQPVSPELEADLRNLISLNRHFGSYRLIRYFLRRWLKPGNAYRVLDLCTASGDIPRMMVDWARKRGVRLQIDAVDFQASTVEIARRWSAEYPEIKFHVADARNFEAPARSHDFVFCSLALHHFSEADAAEILRRCAQWARRGALVADLERSRLTAAAVWLVTAMLYREPMTRFDARVSVQRAFTRGEMIALARAAGWEHARSRGFAIGRMAIWLRREEEGS